MREIKFRARNASSPRCWIYGYFVVEDGGNYIINNEGKFKVIAGSEGQYIGRRDKNNKEIYEEDILSGPKKFKGIVEFKDGAYMVRKNLLYYQRQIMEFKIIGNKWENPELLKGE